MLSVLTNLPLWADSLNYKLIINWSMGWCYDIFCAQFGKLFDNDVFLPRWQFVPFIPLWQLQMYDPPVFMQSASPQRSGFSSHSLMSKCNWVDTASFRSFFLSKFTENYTYSMSIENLKLACQTKHFRKAKTQQKCSYKKAKKKQTLVHKLITSLADRLQFSAANLCCPFTIVLQTPAILAHSSRFTWCKSSDRDPRPIVPSPVTATHGTEVRRRAVTRAADASDEAEPTIALLRPTRSAVWNHKTHVWVFFFF